MDADDGADRQEEKKKITEKVHGCVMQDMQRVGVTGEDARLRWSHMSCFL